MLAGPVAVSYAVLALGVALGVGSVRDFFKVAAVHTSRRSQLASSDAWILSRSTGLPAALWLTGFALVIAVCAAFSAWLLWGMLGG
jgi:hypothetical protein